MSQLLEQQRINILLSETHNYDWCFYCVVIEDFLGVCLLWMMWGGSMHRQTVPAYMLRMLPKNIRGRTNYISFPCYANEARKFLDYYCKYFVQSWWCSPIRRVELWTVYILIFLKNASIFLRITTEYQSFFIKIVCC